MSCSSGCQPHILSKLINQGVNIRVERAKGLYEDDQLQSIQKSYGNPIIQKIYQDYLGETTSHLAHHLLHTTYYEKSIYEKKITKINYLKMN